MLLVYGLPADIPDWDYWPLHPMSSGYSNLELELNFNGQHISLIQELAFSFIQSTSIWAPNMSTAYLGGFKGQYNLHSFWIFTVVGRQERRQDCDDDDDDTDKAGTCGVQGLVKFEGFKEVTDQVSLEGWIEKKISCVCYIVDLDTEEREGHLLPGQSMKKSELAELRTAFPFRSAFLQGQGELR